MREREPIPQARFRELIRAVCDGSYSTADLLAEGEIEDWDVSQIRDFSHAFAEAHAFNRDISRWDVSQATNMDSRFSNAYVFNVPIDGITHITTYYLKKRKKMLQVNILQAYDLSLR